LLHPVGAPNVHFKHQTRITLKLKEPEMIYKKGKPTAVIVPLADYQEMLERIEDAADVAWLKKVRLKGTSYRPFSTYLKESKRVSGRH
jgi:hypothetical protein